jgi:hypothetical protein
MSELDTVIFIISNDSRIDGGVWLISDCNFLQIDINWSLKCCFESYVHLGIQKTNITAFILESNFIRFNYDICDDLILGTDCLGGLHGILDSKLYFYQRHWSF